MKKRRFEHRAPEANEQARVRLISGRLREQRKRVAAPLRRGVFLVPVTITSLGLMAGFYSLVSAINAHFELAAVMIMVAFVCDGLDGRVARMSRTSSQFGVEYDSLSDVVAFGVAPAGLIYSFALSQLGVWGWMASGIFVVCGALRLARFNIQVASTDKRRFTGLPVPGAALMIAGLVLAYSYFELHSPRVLAGVAGPLTLALAAAMISRVPYPSFKSLNPRRTAPVELLVGVLIVAAFLIAMPQFTMFVAATAYVLSGPILMLRGEKMSKKVPVLRAVAVASTQGADGNIAPAVDQKKTAPLRDTAPRR
jgi:CDP-diacylglycerol--serine O-phosphatidyltransferase